MMKTIDECLYTDKSFRQIFNINLQKEEKHFGVFLAQTNHNDTHFVLQVRKKTHLF